MDHEEFVECIDDWISGKTLKAKLTGFDMQENLNSVKEFSRNVFAQGYLKKFTLMYYDDNTWAKIELLLKSKL